MTVQDPSGGSGSADQYSAWLAGLELGSIEVVRLQAERRLSGVAPISRYELAAGWTVEENQIFWRYDLTAHLTDDANSDYGDVQTSVLLRAVHSEPEADPACIERFGATSGTMITHPYLREVVATTALRLGFPGVMLPMITARPDEQPLGVSAATTGHPPE